MNLASAMSRKVQVVAPEATIHDAASMMRRADVGMLPVVDGHHTVGVITDRDIAIRAVADGRDPNRTRVREIMSADLVCVFEDQSLEDAIALMSQRRIQRLLVMTRDQRLAGVVSASDAACICHGDSRVGPLYEQIARRSVASLGV